MIKGVSDLSKQYLGGLCKRVHESEPGSGKTWRYSKGKNCIQCLELNQKPRSKEQNAGYSRTRRAKVKSRPLLPPDRVCLICAKPFHGAAANTKLCSLECGRESWKRKAEEGLNLEAFDNWSPDMAYALGLFYTDGCIRRQKGDDPSWTVRFDNTDLATVEFWHRFVGGKRKIGSASRDPNKRIYWSILTSNRIGDRLIALGSGPRKSWAELHIPDMPEDCLPHFLRGVVDGDGCLTLTKNEKARGGCILKVGVASNSAVFREALCKVYESRGWCPQQYAISVSVSGADAEQLCLWLYGDDGPRMDRKYQVWQHWQEIRAPFGGLICEVNRYAHQKGVRPKEWHSLLGTQSDPEISRVAGVSYLAVRRARIKLGIPSHTRRVA